MNSEMGWFWESMSNIEKAHREREEEFRRLCAEPCMTTPKPGDRVLVAAGLIGRGFLWVRTEAEVLAVADTSVKVRLESTLGGKPHEEWIHPALVTDVLGSGDDTKVSTGEML